MASCNNFWHDLMNSGGFSTPAKYRAMVTVVASGKTVPLSQSTVYPSSEVFIPGRIGALEPYQIAVYETSWQLWNEVYDWAVRHGYRFANPGLEGGGPYEGVAVNAGLPAAVLKTRPVTTLNFRDIVVWCNAYSEMAGKTPVYTDAFGAVLKDSAGSNTDKAVKRNANGFRLPTEAEWEFAARGGGFQSGFAYAGSNDLDKVSWNPVNSGWLGPLDQHGVTIDESHPDFGAHPVGQKIPNSLGLYDMSGNAYEFCWDWYDIAITTTTPADGPDMGVPLFGNDVWIVIRGGSYMSSPPPSTEACKVASRSYTKYNYLEDSRYGFRTACSVLP